MTPAAESPSPSSSSGSDAEFAALLEKEIDEVNKVEVRKEYGEDTQEDIQDDIEVAEQRHKKINVMDVRTDEDTEAEMVSDGVDITCPHPIVVRNLCAHCGVAVEESGSCRAFNYIYKDFRIEQSAAEKLRKEHMKHLLKDKKLILILDLDHTLVNSVRIQDLTPKEEYLLYQIKMDKDDPDLYAIDLDRAYMLTKLRPFVHTFLKEAKNMFEMYIYTMGNRGYADEIVELLDPDGVYFPSRVICRSDNTSQNQKSLDCVIGSENMVIILDDTEKVWEAHMGNLIVMQRYHYFHEGVKYYNPDIEPLSLLKKDENESDGVLASILNVLRRAHARFFDPENEIELAMRDVRQILPAIKMEILQGCHIVFSKEQPKFKTFWKLAEAMGARCFSDVNNMVTHVVATVSTTMTAEWARDNNKFLVTPQWIEVAHYFWQRQKEEDFPVALLVRKNCDGSFYRPY